ncbi:MAG: nucleotidyltransferase domain-containing protein [Epsilonproteobacteria bacterium]|nr:nucleotidyltransferase domain-containing protein [Campylobacterota bacterium]
MRLSKQELEIIKTTVNEEVGECDIYIFGSRLDDNKRGGDVDIYVDKKLTYTQKLDLIIKLKDRLFLPVDIVYKSNAERLIEKEAKKGVKI